MALATGCRSTSTATESAERTVIENPGERGERAEASTAPEATPTTPPAAANPTPDPLPSLPTRCTPIPPNQQSLAILPPWVAGNTISLVIEKRRFENDRPVAGSTKTTIDLTVERVEPDGSVLFSWAPEEGSIAGVAADAVTRARVRQATGGDIPDLSIRYRLDPDRFFDGSVDIVSLRTAFIDTMAILAAVQGADDVVVDGTREFFEALPDDALINMATEDPQALHALEGVLLDATAPIIETGLLEDPFGTGSPLEVTITSEVTEQADDEGCTHIRLTSVPDPASLADVLNRTADETFGAGTLDGLGGELNLDLVDTTSARYDHGTGFFVEIETTRELRIDDETRVDVTTITIDPVP